MLAVHNWIFIFNALFSGTLGTRAGRQFLSCYHAFVWKPCMYASVHHLKFFSHNLEGFTLETEQGHNLRECDERKLFMCWFTQKLNEVIFLTVHCHLTLKVPWHLKQGTVLF